MKSLLIAIVLTAAVLAAPAAVVPEASAVDITITFENATPQEVMAANWFLGKTNAVRVAHNDAEGNPLEPFADIKELLVDQIQRLIPTWVTAHAEAMGQQVDLRALWKNATPEQQAAAVAALQGS